MEEITASGNLIIEWQQDGKWRVAERDEFRHQTLVEAQGENATLFYREDFGRKHGLPAENWLPADKIAQILVGWAPEERCWILGLQLRLDADGTRWCELARFPVSAAQAYSAQAQRAARALAEVICRPVRVIAEQSAAEPGMPPAPLFTRPPQVPYRLPVRLANQELHEIPEGLRLAYTGRWMVLQIVQAVLYIALAGVFGFVSVRSLRTVYAPVHDPILPYLGLGLMVLLAVIGVWQALRVVRAADMVFNQDRATLYYITSLGRWLKSFRRQARTPMPMRAFKAVAVRNLTPTRKEAEWVLFLQTANEALVLNNVVEDDGQQPPAALQAGAAIANLLQIPLRVMMWGINTQQPHTLKCGRCGAPVTPEQARWGDDGQMYCPFCGGLIDRP